MFRILLIALILGSFLEQGSWALQPAVSTLVDDETLHNAAELTSNAPIEIENFEIPLNLVDSDITQRLPKEVLESLVFKTPRGEKRLRWPISPGDKTYYKRVEDYLKKMHVSTERHRYFTGYRTASKSLILENPKSGAQFSIKVSTDSASGLWKDKQQTIAESKDARLVADYVDEIVANKKFKNVVVMDEPAMFSLGEIDQALVVRTLGELPQGKLFYVPAFSILHETRGAEIALMNGSKNAARYWKTHLSETLGKGLGEYAARTGLTYESPHTQNFLIEFDEKMRPTGRIVIRDLGDVFMFAPFFKAAGMDDFMAAFGREYSQSKLEAAIGFLKGMAAPTWLKRFSPISGFQDTYSDYQQTFFSSFEKSFSKFSGVKSKELVKEPTLSTESYLRYRYKPIGKSWEKYLVQVRKETPVFAHLRRCIKDALTKELNGF